MKIEPDQSAPTPTSSKTVNTASAAPVGDPMMRMEDFQGMDPASMQLQMLFMAKQMAMMTRELARMQIW
jgi:hypothetical protein